MKKFQKYIKRGKIEPLTKILFHGKAPIKRLLMLDKNSFPESDAHIAVHFIKNLPLKIPKYSELHKHDCDEINLIISEDDKLVYKVQFEDETYNVISPATIFIPKGVKHSAEVLSGKGIFVCIVLQGNYKAKG